MELQLCPMAAAVHHDTQASGSEALSVSTVEGCTRYTAAGWRPRVPDRSSWSRRTWPCSLRSLSAGAVELTVGKARRRAVTSPWALKLVTFVLRIQSSTS